jgi:Xaa-Pro aminopeptidase
MFDTTTYRERRAALVKLLHERGEARGLVLLIGHDESPMNYADNAYPFRQDSSFLYFFGHARPGLAGSVDLENGEAWLYGDDLSMDDIVWTGSEPTMAELASAVGASARPRSALAAQAAQAGKLLFLPPYREGTRRELGELLGIAPARVEGLASLPLIRAALALREIKSAAEVAEIEAAVATTVAMHRAALALARPGMVEAEIAARVTELALAGGGGLSFPVIATTKGATLHNHRHDRVLAEGSLFLLDAGAEAPSGYAGDLTTTFPVSRRFDARQKEIYSLVLSMFQAAVEALGPGRPFAAAHDAAAKAAVLGLKELGLMKGDADEAVAKGAHALFFPHGLGHMMGLDVHDMENYGEQWVGYDGAERSTQFGRKSLRLAKTLRPGMVHSVEPGLYFIPELIAAWKAEGRLAEHIVYERLGDWLGFGGIRNEEDWLVTPTGARRLGPGFDKSVQAIEAARG